MGKKQAAHGTDPPWTRIAVTVAAVAIIGAGAWALQVYRELPGLKGQTTEAIGWLRNHDEEIGANSSALLKLSSDRAERCENILDYMLKFEREVESLKKDLEELSRKTGGG